jgi:hypothetical protein
MPGRSGADPRPMVGAVPPRQHNGAVDVTASLEAAVAPDALFAVVSDLGTYPRWLDIVPRADAVEPAAGDPGPAWSVDLRGQLGPLRRSKRIRMVRTAAQPELVVFERRELDGRSHSDWVLRAGIGRESASGPSLLTMELHYGGSMWMPMLDRLLADEIERSRGRLLQVLGVSS